MSMKARVKGGGAASGGGGSVSTMIAPKATLEDLRAQCPNATESEYQRFLKSFPKSDESLRYLKAYLEWRTAHGLDDDGTATTATTSTSTSSTSTSLSSTISPKEKDEKYWKESIAQAMKFERDGGNKQQQVLVVGGGTSGGEMEETAHSSCSNGNAGVRRNSAPVLAAGVVGVAAVAPSTMTTASTTTTTASDEDDDEDDDNVGGSGEDDANVSSLTWAPENDHNHPHNQHLHHGHGKPNNPSQYPDHDCQLLYSMYDKNGDRLRDKHNMPVLYCLPARINLNSAVLGDGTVESTTSVLSTAFALYLDRVLDRNDQQQYTILVDVRPGATWPNPRILTMVSFIKHITTALSLLYPGRLRRCILYPVPKAAVYVYSLLIKPFLHSTLQNTIVLISGSAHKPTCPQPTAKLLSHIDRNVATLLEATRNDAVKESAVKGSTLSTTMTMITPAKKNPLCSAAGAMLTKTSPSSLIGGRKQQQQQQQQNAAKSHYKK